ncbi:ATP-grasp domain-containing protein [Cyclobacteriaceae bacterium]|nr:ATP-grasp domain-containing protein [Cyclobacteriaceae bacterium]
MQKEISDYKIGLLGGGQLGRMLLQSAMDLNLEVAIMDADPNAPCAHLVQHFTVGKLTDYDDVMRFGQDKDLITIEIENVNIEALKALEATGIKVYPQPHIIELIQDKRKQKNFYRSTGIPTADFVLTDSKADVLNYLEMIPAVHKLGTEGYDGRGVQMIRTAADTDKAFDRPGILEKCIDFQTEISVIVARNERGEVATYPSVELSFHPEANLVEFLFSPANLTKEIEIKAQALAVEVITKLRMVGLLAVDKISIQMERKLGHLKLALNASQFKLKGDEAYLLGVLLNLLDNALKYSNDAPNIMIRTQNIRGQLICSIKDHGMGMSKEAQRNIFQKFYRVASGNVHNIKGFGLGLAYVKEIITLHHGSIEVESELKKGTNFIVKFPLDYE